MARQEKQGNVNRVYLAAVEADISASRVNRYNTSTPKSPMNPPSFFDTVDYRYPFMNRPSVKPSHRRAKSPPSGINVPSRTTN